MRAPSPTGSEFEYDIAGALLKNENGIGCDSDDDGYTPAPLLKRVKLDDPAQLDANDILGELEESDDDEAFIAAQQAASNRKATVIKGKGNKKSGGFQAMGLNPNLVKAIIRKGYSVPTPIQRKTIPKILDGVDVVGMARTGSGKTAAFVIPMIEKLKEHSVRVGARGIIFSPSRELALQTMKVIKEFSKGTDLKCVLLVGGDSLEEQFGMIASNPDIIVATPGRFLHLKVEMNLDLRTAEYVVFDEADRLFEMGFAQQLKEILFALPATRQTLLFSATLPKTLVEFASAGLQDPVLIRLDADSKISSELESTFLSVKSADKEGALLHLIQDVIKVPQLAQEKEKKEDRDSKGKKRKRVGAGEGVSPQATIVFAATKHHVDYLARLLTLAGYAVSYVYGSLDQVARRTQVTRFRTGQTNILVVTDVAARGIDIPVLSNVINYDFPPQPKVFVHRVGRTARAGRKGWSYSLVRAEDVPYLLDLQLFLGRRLVTGPEEGKTHKTDYDYANDIICGSFLRDRLESCIDSVIKLNDQDSDLASMREVMVRGERLYNKTKPSAAAESARRAKDIIAEKKWSAINPIFIEDYDDKEESRLAMLARVSSYRPGETVFEIGMRGLNKSEAAEVMKRRRSKIKIDPNRRKKAEDGSDSEPEAASKSLAEKTGDNEDEDDDSEVDSVKYDSDDDSDPGFETSNAFATKSTTKPKTKSFEDPEHFISYQPSTSLAESRGYSLNSFTAQAQGASMDLTGDGGEKGQFEASKQNSGMRWDKKAKKYVRRANDFDGSHNEPGKGMIRGESGQRLPASFRSGKFEAWKKAKRIADLPAAGDAETVEAPGRRLHGKMFHKSQKAPKMPDKYRDDYRVRKKRFDEAKEKGLVKDKGKGELKGAEQIRKDRIAKERRREKSTLPGKRGRGAPKAGAKGKPPVFKGGKAGNRKSGKR